MKNRTATYATVMVGDREAFVLFDNFGISADDVQDVAKRRLALVVKSDGLCDPDWQTIKLSIEPIDGNA